MLKRRDGSNYRLNHPNPLLEKQSKEWEPVDSNLFNIDNIGDTLGVDLNPGSANLDQIGRLEEEDLEVLKNHDGTPYKLNGDAKLFDTENVDQDFMHSVDQEVIQLSGSPVYYYKVFIDESNYDELYMESRNKIRLQQGIELYAHWEPVTPTNDMGAFGIDSPDEVNFGFNIREFKETTGDDLPIVGSLIYTPFDKNWWEVIQQGHAATGEAFKIWGKYRFLVLARKYQESITDQEPTRPELNASAEDIIIR